MRIINVLIASGLVGMASCGVTTSGELPVSGSSPSSSPIVPAAYGIVRNSDGNPIDGVMVNVDSLDQPPRAIPEMAVITGGLGAYEWPLAPGKYRIYATADGVGSDSVEIIIIDGVRARADLELTR
jgi:hypothetical protein